MTQPNDEEYSNNARLDDADINMWEEDEDEDNRTSFYLCTGTHDEHGEAQVVPNDRERAGIRVLQVRFVGFQLKCTPLSFFSTFHFSLFVVSANKQSW